MRGRVLDAVCVFIVGAAIWFGLVPVELAFAADYGVYFAGDDTFTDTANVYLMVTGSSSMGGACGGVCGVSGTLSYDGSKIEMVAAGGMQGFDFTQGESSVVLYKQVAANDGAILSYRFRNKGLAPNETTTVTLSGISLTNADVEVGAGNTSFVLRYVAPPAPQPAEEPVYEQPAVVQESETHIDEQEGNESARADNEEKPEAKVSPKSSDASLKGISLSDGDLIFNKNILNYDVIVGEDVSKIVIKAEKSNAAASVSGDGEWELRHGVNEFKIEVTAEDGTKKEYVVKVYRDGVGIDASEYEKQIGGLAAAVVVLTVVLVGAGVWATVYFLRKKKRLS